MELQYTDIFNEGAVVEIAAEITTDHLQSSYGLPVVVLSDGLPLDANSWVLLNYSVIKATPDEAALMERWLANTYAMLGLQATPAQAAGILGKLGGATKSPKRAKASAANGRLGGRPRKVKPDGN